MKQALFYSAYMIPIKQDYSSSRPRDVGFYQVWYTPNGSKEHLESLASQGAISLDEYQLDNVVSRVHYFHEAIPFEKNGSWKPIIGPYNSQAYLLNNTIIVLNELQKKDVATYPPPNEVFPTKVLSILSQKIKSIEKTAQQLELPLEEIAKPEGNKK